MTTRTFIPGPESTIKGEHVVAINDDGTMTLTFCTGKSMEIGQAQLERIERYSIETTPHQHIVNTIDPERRNALLKKSHDLGDRVRQDRRNPDVWLVSSSQFPNVWYRVKDGRSCGCAWFAKKQSPCRHLVRVSWELWKIKKKNAIAA